MSAIIVWKLFECRGGARWLSVDENYAGKVCNFSGCGCRSRVKLVGETSDRTKAADWFRRPAGKAGS